MQSVYQSAWVSPVGGVRGYSVLALHPSAFPESGHVILDGFHRYTHAIRNGLLRGERLAGGLIAVGPQ